MDNSKKFWKAKRIVEWCASGRETELDRTEEGSDEYGRAAGDDSTTTQLAASSESSALTSVKKELSQEDTQLPVELTNGESQCASGPRWQGNSELPRQISQPQTSGSHPHTFHQASYSGTPSPGNSSDMGATWLEDVTRPGSAERDTSSKESSDGESPLETMLNERLRHFRTRWQAGQRIVDEIGDRLRGPSTSTLPPAIAAYRPWTRPTSQHSQGKASGSAESPVPRTARCSGSRPRSSVGRSARPSTSFDGEFKRPYPVSKASRGARTQRPVANLPPAPISPYLSTFSVFLHTQRRHMFPENQSFRRFVLDIRRIIREEHAATLDSWCFPKERLPCWLMAHQYPLNKLLVLYEIEIVQVQPGTFLLHHVGNDYAKRENAAAILERARAMYVEPAQFLYERECMVTWLLRVHRCIQQLRIQLSELVESPEEFCQLFKLHGKYTILDLAVSATTSLSGRSLFLFIDNSSALTELSFTGMRLVHPSDNFSLGVLVAANRLLRKIAFHRCQIADGNLSGIVGVAMGLAYLESFSISLCNSESSIERSEQLCRLLATNDRRCLRQFCLGVGCDLKPIIDTLCANRSLVDVRITQPISTPSELTKLCTLAGANRHLKHLHLSIDFESALSRKYNQHALSKFVENAKLDLLKLENCVFTMRGVKAIAEGLKKNGIEGMLWRDAEVWPTPTSHSHQRYLKALRLRGEDLTCEHLNVILEALEANRTLEMLDVGRVRSSLSISHADVTQKIIDDALRQRERQALSLQSNPVAAVRVNKVHFAEEFQLLLSAMRNDVTFRKLKLSFCDVSRETFDAHSFHFSYLLTVLPFYAVAETLETLEIDVSLPGIHDVTFLGLSILVATSKTLTDLRITLGDTCGEFTSILLLQGLASSISIRSLTMSGWGLKYPVSLWFRQFCTMNQTLRKLHIHVANREDESNAAFIEALPKTLMNCQWLVDFQFTCGKPAEAVFLPDVLSLIGSNKKLHSLAIKMVITAATVPREVENVFEKMLTLEMGVRLRRCMDSPGFTEAIAERSWLSTDATERAISTTKALISKVLGRRAKVHRRVRPSSPDLSDTDATLSGDMDEPTQERLFRSIRVGSSSSWHCRDISVDKYQMRLSKVSHTMATIYNEERKYFTSLVESLVKQIADFSISGPAGDTFGAPVSFS